MDLCLLHFPLTLTIKRPAVSTSWGVQPDWSALFHHSLTCYWECVLYVVQMRCTGTGTMASWEDVSFVSELAQMCMSCVDLIGRDLHVLISCMAYLAPKVGVCLCVCVCVWCVCMCVCVERSVVLWGMVCTCFKSVYCWHNPVIPYSWTQTSYVSMWTNCGHS